MHDDYKVEKKPLNPVKENMIIQGRNGRFQAKGYSNSFQSLEDAKLFVNEHIQKYILR